MGNLEKVQRQLAQDLKIAAVKYLHEGSVSIKLLEQRTFKHNDHFTVSDAITQVGPAGRRMPTRSTSPKPKSRGPTPPQLCRG